MNNNHDYLTYDAQIFSYSQIAPMNVDFIIIIIIIIHFTFCSLSFFIDFWCNDLVQAGAVRPFWYTSASAFSWLTVLCSFKTNHRRSTRHWFNNLSDRRSASLVRILILLHIAFNFIDIKSLNAQCLMCILISRRDKTANVKSLMQKSRRERWQKADKILN